MASSVKAHFLQNPPALPGTGTPGEGALFEESGPAILWGQGTPAAIAPFTTVNKGSLYLQVNDTDDSHMLWVKVDEGGDAADWKRLGINYLVSKEFNIDNGSGQTDDDILIVPPYASHVVAARVIYTEATDTAGADGANVKIGTAVGGAQIVAATNLEVSKSVGDVTDLTIASGAVAADGIIAIRHTGIAATEAGKYKVLVVLA